MKSGLRRVRSWLGRLRLGVKIALILVAGLLAAAWVWIPSLPPQWPTNPVAWWTPGEIWNRPQTAMHPVRHGVAEVREVGGREAFSVGYNGRITLGRWSASEHAMTLAFWMRLEAEPGLDLNQESILLAESWEPRIRLQFLIVKGHPALGWSEGPPRELIRMDSMRAAPSGLQVHAGEWAHVAFVVDSESVRFVLNGQPVGEVALPELAIVQNARLALGPGSAPRMLVSYDDVVLFPRVISEAEARSLASARRGELPRKYHRIAVEERLSHWTLAGQVGLMVLLGILAAVLIFSRTVGRSWRHLREPETRFAVGLFVVQMLLTVAAVFWFGAEARRLDRLDFEREADQFAGRLEADLRRLGDLTNMARDWALPRSNLANLTHSDWEAWAQSHRVEYDFPGFLGIGLATVVLPEWQAAVERIWSERLGFPFRVWHDPTWGVAVRPKRILEPLRAPVVAYYPWRLPPQLWLSNQTILGKDLLAMSTNTAMHAVMPEPDRIADTLADGNLNSSGIIELGPTEWYGRPVRGIRIYSASVYRRTDGRDKFTASLASGLLAFTSVDLGRWLQEELQRTPPRLACQLWVGETGEDRHQLGFDSGESHPDAQFRSNARFHATREVKAFYYRLWIDFASTARFEAQARQIWQWHLGIAGLAFSVLTSGMFLIQGRERSSFKRQTQQITLANLELKRAHKERERLSRNLHDGTIQNLYAVGLHLQYARRALGTGESPALHGLGEAQHLVQDTIVELREFLIALKDESQQGRPFRTVFQELFGRLQPACPVELALEVSKASDAMPSGIVVQLVQIAREALSNALRHAQATRVRIELLPLEGLPTEPSMESRWCLLIEDNGVGISAERGGSRGAGLGLNSMRERAVELGGELTMESADGLGTRIRLVFQPHSHGTPPPGQPD